MNVQLYIGGKHVDLTEDIAIPITYPLMDLQNPSVVKNSYSSTITLPATKNNNDVFGHFYQMDRMYHYPEWTVESSIGIQFNPSKRVDYQLFVNGECRDSGYCQLNDVQIDGEVKAYNITLYNGLGDFFYNLKYKDGEYRPLSDIQFFIEKDGEVLPKEDELDFEITKDFISECFTKDWDTKGNELTDTITFIPALNGKPEDFDGGHCLINTKDNVFDTEVVDSGKHYGTKDGYLLASIEDDFTEWDMRDLRSYLQRPAIKVSRLIEAICREENSGYRVQFDSKWFNDDNPYWSKAFVALPTLQTTIDDNDSEVSGTITARNTLSGDRVIELPYTVDCQGITMEGDILHPNYPDTSTLEFNVDFSLVAALPTNPSDEMFISSGWMHSGDSTFIDWFQAITAQALVYSGDEIVGFSPLYYLTNKSNGSYTRPDRWLGYTPLTEANASPVFGHFHKLSDDPGTSKYQFISDNGMNTFSLRCRATRKESMRVVLRLSIEREGTRTNYGLYDKTLYVDELRTGYTWAKNVSGNQNIMSVKTPAAVVSGSLIKKKNLLKSDSTPADFLLSYTKLFGLYYVKEINSRDITIYARPQYFTGNIVDWSKRIDYSKNVNVQPLMFDKKYYRFRLNTPDSYFAEKYFRKYDQQYAQRRISTGYNFNSEIQDIYDDSIYQQTIPVIDSSKWYRFFYDKQGRELPACVNRNMQITYYNGTEEITKDLYGALTVDLSRTTDWTAGGKDIWAKQCFYSGDKGLEEIESCLLFYNGVKPLQDRVGKPINYWLTDDLPIMSILNEEMCWLNTASETDEEGNIIAIKVNELPQYISYITDGQVVKHSFDLGLPKEIYCDFDYESQVTLYDRFWDSFYRDQFNIDTRKITCYVKLDDLKVNSELLRDFYFFEGCYWILNKIEGYDVNSHNTTRCEFIKVEDTKNYTRQYDYFTVKDLYISTDNIIMDYDQTEASVDISSTTTWTLQ